MMTCYRSRARRTGSEAIYQAVVFCLTICAFIVLAATAARSQGCQCVGPLQDDYRGGNGAPLDWIFHTYLRLTGQVDRSPLICYERNVTNRSTTIDVVKVHWEVAGYNRQFIPASKDSPSCNDILDEMKTAPTAGRLFYGVAQFYDTQVRQPRNGWAPTLGTLVRPTQFQPPQRERAAEVEPPTLRSDFTFYSDQKNWARIVIDSTVESDGKVYKYIYRLKNIGNISVSVLTNIAVTPSMVDHLSIVRVPVELAPDGDWSRFTATSEGPFEARNGTVIFYDKLGKRLLGADVAGFYSPVTGKPLRFEDELWKNLSSFAPF
jgi:hypothetical protein